MMCHLLVNCQLHVGLVFKKILCASSIVVIYDIAVVVLAFLASTVVRKSSLPVRLFATGQSHVPG